MQQAHSVIVTGIQNAASTPCNCHKNTKDNKPTLHTCNSAHQTMSKWKAQKFEKCQITTNLHKIIGICLFLLNLIHTYAHLHFYSNVCSQLTKYYVTIQLAEKHLLSQETFRQKIRCKISRFHLSFPSLSLSGRPNNANKLGGEKLFISLGPLMMTMMAMTMMTMMTMLMMVMMMSKVWWEA